MRYLRLYHIILRLHVHAKCVTKLYCICLLGLCGRIQCDNNPLAELRNVRVEMFDRTFARVLSNDYCSVHPGFCRRRCALALEGQENTREPWP